jgi:hypothetical protein
MTCPGASILVSTTRVSAELLAPPPQQRAGNTTQARVVADIPGGSLACFRFGTEDCIIRCIGSASKAFVFGVMAREKNGIDDPLE